MYHKGSKTFKQHDIMCATYYLFDEAHLHANTHNYHMDKMYECPREALDQNYLFCVKSQPYASTY